MKKLWGMWTRFWFEKECEKNFKLFERCFLFFLIVLYLNRAPDLSFFYSNDGILPYPIVHDLIPMEYRYSILFWFQSKAAMYIAYWGLIASLALCFFKKLKPFFFPIALLLHVSFLHRNIAILYGVDMIASFYLLYFTFAALFSKSRDVRSMVFRLLQIQLCLIYGFAGLEKLKGAQWWAGDAVWNVLANPQLTQFDFSFVSRFPVLISVLTYGTLLWEIYFPALIWVPLVRPYVLIIGVFFHLAIGISVSIPYFSLLMVMSYLAFVDEKWIQKWAQRKK